VDAAPIPHLVVDKEDCLSCHGYDPKLPLPVDHQGRGSEFCQACHVPVDVPAILHPLADHESCLECHGEGSVAEFSLSTHQGRENASCQSCHDEAGVVPLMLPHEVAGHEDCLMCHGSDAFAPYPDNHTGWGNEFCVLCHQENPALEEVAHAFPQEHDGANSNCMLCHVDGDLTKYSCDACHQPAAMDGAHEARGISSTEELCVLCHPTGQVP